jgi:hypothetical protein
LRRQPGDVVDRGPISYRGSMTDSSWIADQAGERCPACGSVVEWLGSRMPVAGRPDAVPVLTGPPRCPQGHDLPEPAELHQWNLNNPPESLGPE